MSRVVTVVVVAFLAVAGLVLPQPSAVTPGTGAEPSPPKFAVCLVEQGGGRSTEISVVSLGDGFVQLSLFAGGREAGSIGVDVSGPGSTVFPIVDVAAVGTIGAFVEFPSGQAAATSMIRGPQSLSADLCVSDTPGEISLTGARTTSPDRFELHLINPFATDALVRLVVTSEVGIESNPAFSAVVVRARSSVIMNMTQLTPGRERLSVLIEHQQGRVVAIGRQTAPAEGAMWSAVEPLTDWFVPLGDVADGRRIVIGNPQGADVEYQVDAYRTGGLEPTVLSGSIPAGGEATLDLSDLDEASIRGVRILSTSPVVATVWQASENALSAVTGTGTQALRWLVPGWFHPAGGDPPAEGELPDLGESARLIIFNTGIDDAEVVVTTLGGDGGTVTVIVPAEGVLEVPISSGDARVVDSDVPVVVAWIGGVGGTGTTSLGFPVQDG